MDGSIAYPSDVHLTKMRFVLSIHCLPEISWSSSTSTGSQIATQKRFLTWTIVETSTAIFHRWRERRSSDYRQFLPEPGSARYFSTPPLATVWSIYQIIFDDFFEVYFTKTVTLSLNVQTDFSALFNTVDQITWSVILRCRVLSLSDRRYSLNPLSQTRIDWVGRYRIRLTFKLSCVWH